MMKKDRLKFLSFLAFFALTLSLFSAAEGATLTSGNFKYTVENGTAAITGYVSAPTGQLTFPAMLDGHPVTSISSGAFQDCAGLTGITLPVGLTSIGNYAFFDCTALNSVSLPAGVKSIGKSAFAGCAFLTSIRVPDGITVIEDYTFSGCSSLKSVTLPAGVTAIGRDAFSSCSALTGITLPNTVDYIGNYAFQNCSALTSIRIPEKVAAIGFSMFSGCTRLSSVSLPTGLTRIGDYVFMDCAALKKIDMPSGLTFIGSYAFAGCTSLERFHIPSGVTSVKAHAFSRCKALTEVSIPDGVTHIDEYAFGSCPALKNVDIPASVQIISRRAFEGCSALTAVRIPAGITAIENRTFKNCSALSKVEIQSAPHYISDSAFENCKALRSIVIPEGTGGIYGSAFKGSGLTSVHIPSSITTIGEGAFDGKVLLSVETGSYAHQWAIEKGQPFETVGGVLSLSAVTAKYTDREVGQPNRYYATAQGGTAPYTYYFRLYKGDTVYHNSGWITADNYRIDFTEAGTYTMTVKVQDAKGNKTDWVECAKTVVKASAAVTAPTVKVSGKYTEREPGQPNRYYATAQGGTAPYTYYFRLYKDGAVYHNSGWITADNYRIDFTETGTYTMTVKVQDVKGNKTDWVKCAKTVVKAAQPLTATATGKYTEREPGQPNRYYATAQGGTAPYTYYFRLYKDGVVYHNSGWISINNYRIDFTEPGIYTMTVKVQDGYGQKTDWVYCTKTTVKSVQPLTATATGKYTEREPGQPNRYYATAQGGTAPYTYYFRLYKDGAVYHNSGWITADNYRIDFTEAGTYTMTVKVQDANGNKADWVYYTKTVVKTASAVTAPTVKVSGKYTDREVGQPNRYYATAQGGTAPYTYYFRLYKDGVVYHNSGWITADNYRIDFTEAGTYTMTVKVQDAKGNKSDWVSGGKTTVK